MPGRPLISLTMIVKNEEANLARVVASARGIIDELIVVDTGSTDRTVEIAESLGAKVFHFTWVDDFSAARNFALAQASGEWILILDGDDVAIEPFPGALRAEIRGLDPRVHFLRMSVSSPGAEGSGFTVFSSRRLFRNVPEIRWYHPIHEMLFHETRDAEPGVELGTEALAIQHTGYADHEHRAREKKGNRNLRILKNAIVKNPDNEFWHYYLALEHANAGHDKSALRMVKHALRRFGGKIRPDFEGTLRCLGVRIAGKLGRDDVALKIGLPGVRAYAFSELCYQVGLAYFRLKRYDESEHMLRLAVSLRGRFAEFQIEAGAGSWKAMIQLGTIAWATGRPDTAIERWRAAYEWEPSQPLTNLALGRGLAASGRIDEARPLLERAAEIAPKLAEAQGAWVEALVNLGRHDEAHARLVTLTAESPEILRYWMYLVELLRGRGEFAACAAVCAQALQHHVGQAALYEKLGMALQALGRRADAASAFAAAASLAKAA